MLLTFEDLGEKQKINFTGMFNGPGYVVLLTVCIESSLAFQNKMPNPIRTRANGRPVYHIFAICFIDDVSGNVSKQWNKNYVVYMSNANLPREHLDKEYNVRFVGSSPHVNAIELAQGIRESFE